MVTNFVTKNVKYDVTINITKYDILNEEKITIESVKINVTYGVIKEVTYNDKLKVTLYVTSNVTKNNIKKGYI